MKCSLYGMIGYRTDNPPLMNRELEPEERGHVKPAVGDAEYINPNQTSQ